MQVTICVIIGIVSILAMAICKIAEVIIDLKGV